MSERNDTTKNQLHGWIQIFLTTKLENPESIWLQDWINCLRFICGCSICQRRLKKSNIDVNMIEIMVDKYFDTLHSKHKLDGSQ